MAASPPSSPADDVTLTFGGNATTLLRLGPFTLLTDPNFLHRGQRAYLGKGLWTKRLTEPALQPANDLFYRYLHRPALINTLKFPLYF